MRSSLETSPSAITYETEPQDSLLKALDEIETMIETKVENKSELQRPEFFNPPFNRELFTRDCEISAEDLTKEGVPDLTFFGDTHLIGAQPARKGIEGLASGKRRFFGLARVRSIRNTVRMIDTITRVAVHKTQSQLQERFHEGGLIIHGGDLVDAYETSAFTRALAVYERNLASSQKKAQASTREESLPKTQMVHLTGNHDTAVVGPDKALGYNPIEKSFGKISTEKFQELVEAVKRGYSWRAINKAYLRTGCPESAIHPAFRWYLEKLSFGSQFGRFIEKDEEGKVKTQVLILNSELKSKAGKPEDFQEALNEIGITEISRYGNLYREIMTFVNQEEKAQDVLIETMLQDCQKGAQTIVYTHSPEGIQKQLVQATGEQLHLDTTEATKFIQEKVVIWGGHRHLGEEETGELPGINFVYGMTRQFIGPAYQRAGRFPLAYPRSYQDIPLVPEILTGPANKPEKIRLGDNEVREEFKRILRAAQAIESEKA